MGRFSWPYRNLPTRQFFLNIPGDGGGISRDDEFLVLDLVRNSTFFDEHADIIPGKFTSRPGSHDR